MNEQRFRSEMRRAQTLQRNSDDPMQSEYWAGYQRGLRRAYHGEKFGTPEEHAAWQAAIDSPDERRQMRGRGYNEAILWAETANPVGRPRVGDVDLPQLAVPQALLDDLAAKAEAEGITVPEARREAYRRYCQ